MKAVGKSLCQELEFLCSKAQKEGLSYGKSNDVLNNVQYRSGRKGKADYKDTRADINDTDT